MRFSLLKGLVALASVQSVAGSSWFGKTVYNKWHETELERWLTDHNVPYPAAADRKDLELLVKDHWNDKVVTPYNSWDLEQLKQYVISSGEQVSNAATDGKDYFVDQVKSSWKDTADTTDQAYGNVKDWIFDTWTDSQLKAFADKNNIPVPQPRNRDSLLKTVRSNYQNAATKLNEYYAYPGDWLYSSWSNSDLKAWADARGIAVPQPTKRDQLIAAIRRNSRYASQNLQSFSNAAASSAAAATQTVADAVFDTWSDSQIKKWADEKGIKVPQGSKRNEVLAIVRRQNAIINENAAKYSSSAVSAYGAATSKAGNQYAQATDVAGTKLGGLQNGVWEYIEWAKTQVGLAGESVSSAGSAASKSATSATHKAYKSASSASKDAYKSASSASKSASSLASSASKVASSASKVASKAYDEL